MNIPARTELGRRVRACFKAEDGKKLLANDLSQIELRVLAHLAGEKVMQDIFWRDGDIHTATAALVFGKQESEVDKLSERAPCKNVNFAIVYGETEQGLQLQLALDGIEWSLAECQKFIGKWFGLYPGVRGYMDEQHERARRYGFVWDLFGRVRWVPEVRSVHEKVTEEGLRQAGNMPVQGTAAGILKLGMKELAGRGADFGAVPLLPVHDELIHEVDESKAEEYCDVVSQAMEGAVKLDVPVKCGGMASDRWEKD
jgi:DNA polymerase-1